MTLTTPTTIPHEVIQSIISTASQGIYYWASDLDVNGSTITVYDDEERKTHTITTEQLHNALIKWAYLPCHRNENHLYHNRGAGDALIGYWDRLQLELDAVAGDLILQMAIFGEQVYA